MNFCRHRKSILNDVIDTSLSKKQYYNKTTLYYIKFLKDSCNSITINTIPSIEFLNLIFINLKHLQEMFFDFQMELIQIIDSTLDLISFKLLQYMSLVDNKIEYTEIYRNINKIVFNLRNKLYDLQGI